MKKIKQRLLGGSKLLTKDEKRLLFDLLTDNSKVNKDRLEADKKLSTYFSELYIKYLVPKDILSLEKKCHPEFINKIGGIYIEGSKLFNIDFIYVKEGYTKDDYSITTDQYIIENISEYSSYMDELPAEINAMKNGSVPDLALELLKEVSLK